MILSDLVMAPQSQHLPRPLDLHSKGLQLDWLNYYPNYVKNIILTVILLSTNHLLLNLAAQEEILIDYFHFVNVRQQISERAVRQEARNKKRN